MPKKRKSRGRRKGGKGRGKMVQCYHCGAQVPADKAKKVYKKSSFIEPRLAHELRKMGAYIGGSQSVRYLCINCAVHRGYYSPRSKEDRKVPFKKRRRDSK